MIKNVKFETKKYKHGISLWINISHKGLTERKLLGSSFKSMEEIALFILSLSIRKIDEK